MCPKLLSYQINSTAKNRISCSNMQIHRLAKKIQTLTATHCNREGFTFKKHTTKSKAAPAIDGPDSDCANLSVGLCASFYQVQSGSCIYTHICDINIDKHMHFYIQYIYIYMHIPIHE